MNYIISVYDTVKNKCAKSRIDGYNIFIKIKVLKYYRNNNEKIILDFNDIEEVSYSFIKECIGRLIEKDGVDKVATYLVLDNVQNEFMKNLISISINFAQEKYDEKKENKNYEKI
jgi:hypothetical protein